MQSPSLVGTTVSGPLDNLGTLVGTTFNVQNEARLGGDDETLRVESETLVLATVVSPGDELGTLVGRAAGKICRPITTEADMLL